VISDLQFGSADVDEQATLDAAGAEVAENLRDVFVRHGLAGFQLYPGNAPGSGFFHSRSFSSFLSFLRLFAPLASKPGVIMSEPAETTQVFAAAFRFAFFVGRGYLNNDQFLPSCGCRPNGAGDRRRDTYERFPAH
jgi:hypothetical protein